MEIRTSLCGMQLSTRIKNESKIVSGYAVKWDKLSKKITENDNSFYEKIKKGAFAESLKDKNQKALFLHHWNDYLGSIQENTLFLEEDTIGLAFTLTLPNNALGDQIYKEIKGKKLSHVSVSFYSVEDNWETINFERYRTITKAELVEISLVYNPAYTDSVVVPGDQRTILWAKDFSLEMKRRELIKQIENALGD